MRIDRDPAFSPNLHPRESFPGSQDRVPFLAVGGQAHSSPQILCKTHARDFRTRAVPRSLACYLTFITERRERRNRGKSGLQGCALLEHHWLRSSDLPWRTGVGAGGPRGHTQGESLKERGQQETTGSRRKGAEGATLGKGSGVNLGC